jgi:hypothetical protein
LKKVVKDFPKLRFYCYVAAFSNIMAFTATGIGVWQGVPRAHGLPEVSLGLTIPYPSMPCRRATADTVLRPFQGWPARKVGGLLAVFYPFVDPLTYTHGFHGDKLIHLNLMFRFSDTEF